MLNILLFRIFCGLYLSLRFMLYFFFTDVPGFYRMAKLMLYRAMTIFLIISTLFPNGQNLRPMVFERDNIFVDMVRMLYRADTCTNVVPESACFQFSECMHRHL